MESEIDKFLEKYEDKNISISYDENKINLIQKNLLNHLKNYVINLLILANLKRSIINLWIILQNLNNINLKKSQVVFLKTKKNEEICKRFRRYC